MGKLAAVKKALDMRKAARMKRAAEQGYDPTRVGYHGTGADIDEFTGITWISRDPNLANKYAGMRGSMGGDANVLPLLSREGTAFNADALPNTVTVGSFANEMLSQAKKRGIELSKKEMEELKKLLTDIKSGARIEESGPHYSRHDFWYAPQDMFGEEGANAISGLMDRLGYDSIKMTEQGAPTIGIRNTKNIRSVNAAFDPAKKDSADILAGGAAAAVGLGAASQSGEAEADPVAIADAVGRFTAKRAARKATQTDMLTFGEGMKGLLAGMGAGVLDTASLLATITQEQEQADYLAGQAERARQWGRDQGATGPVITMGELASPL